MGSDKIKVFYFNNGTGGGVLSVIRNLLQFRQHQQIENHVIYTINKDQNKHFVVPALAGAVTEQVFYYSPRWNFTHTCKKLSRLLPDREAVLVANDWLELGMVTHVALCNPVIQILHGDYEYYYNLSVKHQKWIDAYATVAEVMSHNLAKKLPERLNDIYYLPFPVPDVSPKYFATNSKPLQVIFVGRLTEEKGYHLLPLMERELSSKGIKVKWHIVGEVTEAERLAWNSSSHITFYGQLSNEQVIDTMYNMDCLVLPSLAEGMPVTLIEAMKVGLTCLVNDLPGGIQELIADGLTGYKVEKNEVSKYVSLLEHLHNDRTLLKKIGVNANSKASTDFEPITNTVHYEKLVQKCFSVGRLPRKKGRIYGSRLDRSWIPNFITAIIRSF